MWTSWVLVFLVSTIFDVLYVEYQTAVSHRKAHWASLVSVGLFILGCISLVSYLEDLRLIIPAAAGNYVGTYLAVKWETRRDRSRT